MKCVPLCVRTVLCLCAWVGLASVETANAVTYSKNRIAVTADGNYNDKDDWGATPMTLGLLAKRGLQSKLVHYDWADIIGPNDPVYYEQMKTSTLRAADQFGFNRAKFFDCRTDLDSALESLRQEIDASTSSDPLFILAMGPMEVLWRALDAADPKTRGFVTVISHSKWNNTQIYPPGLTHTRTDVEALGVKWIQITNQNTRLYTESNGLANWDPWFWLRDAIDSRMRWTYGRMRASGKPDVSDSGLAYYLLTNDDTGTPSEFKKFFGSWANCCFP
jgi:hypothetical protein